MSHRRTLNSNEQLSSLVDVMINASSAFAVWRDLTNAENRHSYLAVKDYYRGFFEITIDAHFHLFIASIFMLLDDKQNNNRLSVHTLLNDELRKDQPNRKLKKIKEDLSKLDGFFIKITLVRHMVISHRSKSISTREAFTRVGLVVDEIDDSISQLESIMTGICRFKNHSSNFINYRTPIFDDCQNLMRDLERQLNST